MDLLPIKKCMSPTLVTKTAPRWCQLSAGHEGEHEALYLRKPYRWAAE